MNIFDELKNKLSEIHSKALEMEKALESDDFNKIPILLEEKEKMIKVFNETSEKVQLTQEEFQQLKQFSAKIKDLDSKNIKNIESVRSEISSKLSNVAKSKKFMSSYKITRENTPKLFDTSE